METEFQNKKNRRIDGLYRKNRIPEENFYQELDKRNSSFLSFWIVVIVILAVVFFIIVSIAVSLKRESVGSEDIFGQEIIFSNLVSFSERADNIKGDGQATLVFSGKEFAKASGATEEDFSLSGANFEIKKDSIILRGRMKESFIPWPVKLKIDFQTKDNKFLFTLATDSIENIIVFPEDKKKIESTFDQNINSVLAEKGMIAREIQTSDDRLEFHIIKEVK